MNFTGMYGTLTSTSSNILSLNGSKSLQPGSTFGGESETRREEAVQQISAHGLGMTCSTITYRCNVQKALLVLLSDSALHSYNIVGLKIGNLRKKILSFLFKAFFLVKNFCLH